MEIKKITRFLPLTAIGGSMLLIYLTGFYQALDFETIRYHHAELIEYANNNPILTPFMFIGSCAVATILSIPGGLLLSLLGGFLFPQPWCTLYLLLGATLGATLTFWAAKLSFQGRANRKLARIQSAFNKNVISYLLFLRLIPLFPFWLINIIPAFFNVRLRTYVWTTLVGTIPGAVILTQAGKGFNNVFESMEKFSTYSIFSTEIQILLICLAVTALLPIVIKKCQKSHEEQDS